ncbi:sugar diacid recognition domain-containing protein [Nitrincola sp.]|uniref:sugar diacid recognition domain-containing protein n=1 Tax=Nitrincola sp. TaxID=1926584 RepID=UPI003A8E653C
MLLDQYVAQKIVDRAMKICGFNINVMDRNGLIIGSGDEGRIGRVHEGALRVISSRGEIDIHIDRESSIDGVKSGLNIPIFSQGDIVGVVGITGNPERVRKYADLVAMTAELVVEQALIATEVQWDRRQREEVLLRLVEGGPFDSFFSDREYRLGLDLDTPSVVVVMHIGSDDLRGEKDFQRVQRIYESWNKNLSSIEISGMISASHIVQLRSLNCLKYKKTIEGLRESVINEFNYIRENFTCDLTVSVGVVASSREDIISSYQSAMDMLEMNLERDRKVYFAADFFLDLYIYQARNNPSSLPFLERFVFLDKKDSSGVLFKTLKVFFEEDCDYTRCSERLFIHRNTLRYRLGKISDYLELDVSSWRSMMECYIAARLYEYKINGRG